MYSASGNPIIGVGFAIISFIWTSNGTALYHINCSVTGFRIMLSEKSFRFDAIIVYVVPVTNGVEKVK